MPQLAQPDLDALFPREWERVETHISRVVLGAEDVFKIKKPVDFGFLDFRRLDSRRSACAAEVTLNRRLAPDVYLGVVPITRAPDGALRLGRDLEPDEALAATMEDVVEWAVHMRRLPDAARLDVRLAEGRWPVDTLDRVAGVLAAFHRRAPRIAVADEVEVVRRNIDENFAQTRGSIGEHLAPEEARALERWQHERLRQLAPLVGARGRQGFVREGHGDLRLEHVYLDDDGGVRILDCVEFNERFRVQDVCADLAFLTMDLAFVGRVDLAEGLLAAYARESQDYDLYALVDLFESYRAHVRAKIESFVAQDPGVDERRRTRALRRARRYYRLALAMGRPALAPQIVVVVSGGIASGKSTVAAALGRALGLPVIGTDRTRKHLLGVEATTPVHEAPFAGAYSDEMGARVYAEVLRRARVVLGTGRGVILDGTFSRAEQRARARSLADEVGAGFRLVECVAPDEVVAARLAARARGPSESDGRPEVLGAVRQRWQPPRELPPEVRVRVDTRTPVADTVAAVLARLPEGLAARLP